MTQKTEIEKIIDEEWEGSVPMMGWPGDKPFSQSCLCAYCSFARGKWEELRRRDETMKSVEETKCKSNDFGN